jgi:hypothetical protein
MKGVRAIGIAPYLASAPVVNTVTGVIALPSHISTGTTIARFEVKATGNNVIETGTFDEATRTNEFVGVNTFFIPGNDVELRNELQGNNGILKTVFIEDYNGKIYCLGAKNGCDIMTHRWRFRYTRIYYYYKFKRNRVDVLFSCGRSNSLQRFIISSLIFWVVLIV